MSKVPLIKTVMTIDDNPLDQLMYKRIITRSGIIENVISFQLAEEALDYLKTEGHEAIDVIFLDINMPRMNGFEFLEQAMDEFGPAFSRCVVIMLTTSLNPADETRAKEFDVVKAYLDKPLETEDLESVALMLAQ